MAPIITPAVKGREPYILPRQESAYRHKLDIMENAEPISQQVADVLTAKDVHRYPAHDETYDKLKLATQTYCGVPHQEENIVFTNGSDNALRAVLDGFFLPHTSLLILTPTYPHFIEFARNAMTPDHTIHLLPQTGSELGDLQATLRSKTFNLCYLCSPNLPLGYSFTPHQLYLLLNEFKDTMFLVDEAYIQYTEAYEALRQAASATTLITRFTNLVVTRTFSKAFGLAGLRIGCMLSHPENIRSLRVLVNQKSVTALAMRAALETIQQLPYYNRQITQVQEIKGWLSRRLNRLCTSETEIFGINIAGGNYFLLYAKNPALVCQIFVEYGIHLRDKSAEVPNAIRSCIGTRTQMEEVILLVAFINRKTLFRSSEAHEKIKVVIDLDNTLRQGSKMTSPWNTMDDSLHTEHWTVCTNNCTQTPTELHEIVERGMNRKFGEVISPLTYFKDNLSLEKSSIFVVGSESVKEMFGYWGEMDPSEVDAVLVAQLPTLEEIVMVCKLHDEHGILVFYTDSNDYTDLHSCAEVADDSKKTYIPDLGSYMDMMDIGSICIDKASGEQNCRLGYNNTFDFMDHKRQEFIIGDSWESDRKLAQSIPSSVFIHISPEEEKEYCDLNHMCIVLPSIAAL